MQELKTRLLRICCTTLLNVENRVKNLYIVLSLKRKFALY
jgi:hypothetical protein